MKNLTYKVFCPFGGMGAGAFGFANAQVRLLGFDARFVVMGGIDFDPNACRDFELLTGVPEWCADVEAITAEELRARHPLGPDVVFMSPPCKGASKLLSAKKAAEDKYRRMNRLAVVWTGLMLQAWADNLPRLILFENVPHITTRAKDTVEAVRRLLKAAGYVTHDGYHDCGEIGGLAQNRRRFLMVARLSKRVPPLLYQPPKKRVRGCGEVLGELAMPEDESAGVMHKMPKISWLNWIRLALIPAGGDWRDIPGVLAEGQQRRELFRRHHLQPWNEPSSTIGGTGSNGPTSIADPRVDLAFKSNNPNRHTNKYAVTLWEEPVGTITSKAQPGSGGPSVADPRVDELRVKRAYDNGYAVLGWREASPTVAAGSHPGQGAYSVADPRVTCEPRAGAYGVLGWDQPAPTIGAHHKIDNATAAIADARLTDHRGQLLPIPDPRKAPPTPPVIVAQDGTWHRPLTTLELAALQGLPTKVNGSPLVLAGSGSTAWREAIGNAVPPPAAKAIAEQMLATLVGADVGGAFMLSSGGAVWVETNDSIEPGWVQVGHA